MSMIHTIWSLYIYINYKENTTIAHVVVEKLKLILEIINTPPPTFLQ